MTGKTGTAEEEPMDRKTIPTQPHANASENPLAPSDAIPESMTLGFHVKKIIHEILEEGRVSALCPICQKETRIWIHEDRMIRGEADGTIHRCPT